jgi:hypothetical protein
LPRLVQLSESLKANRELIERLATAMAAYCSECIGKAVIEAKSQAMGGVIFKSSVDRMAYHLNCACGKPAEFFLSYYPKPVTR